MAGRKDDDEPVSGERDGEEDRPFLGVERDDPLRPRGGLPWRPRREEAPKTNVGSQARTGGEGIEGEGDAGQSGTVHPGAETVSSCANAHHHAHGAREQKGLLKALALTTTILIVVALGGVLSGSLALLSDAGHMLTDVSALVLALFAIRMASRPRTASKTYGWYRLEILAALANGLALVVIAGIIVHEAIGRLQVVPEVDSRVMMVVAAIGLSGNLAGLWFLHGDRHGSLNVRGAFLHILSDALSSMTVLVGGALIFFTGVHIIDPILSLLISVIIVIGAGKLVGEAVDVLLEATPGHLDHGEVAAAIGSVECVCGVHDLHIWTITSGMYALSVHVVVPKTAIANSNEILRSIKTVLIERYQIDHTTVQIESEGYEHVGAIC